MYTCEIITTVKLTNILITSHSYLCVCVCVCFSNFIRFSTAFIIIFLPYPGTTCIIA